MEYVEEVREVAPRRLEKVDAGRAAERLESLGEEQLLRESIMLVDLALSRTRASVATDRELKDLVCEVLGEAKQRLTGL
ncbi:MAG: hypothetical protein H0V53_10070 [Rubrobacter sp.]|nr:hypothetical protein [Rubrobacter sp.]